MALTGRAKSLMITEDMQKPWFPRGMPISVTVLPKSLRRNAGLISPKVKCPVIAGSVET